MPGELAVSLRTRAGVLLKSEFLRNLGRFSTSTIAAQGLMMVYIILVARALGPEQFGRYSGTYALTGLSIFVVSWGMDTWLLREPGSLASPRAWSGRVIRVKAGTGILWAAALVIVAPLIRPDVFTPVMVLVCAIDVWSDSALNTHSAALNIENRIRTVSRLVFFSRAARLTGGIALVVLGTNDPLIFASVRAATTLGSLLIAAWVVKPNLNAPNMPSTRDVLRMSLPYGISEMLALIYMQADVTLLSFLSGSTNTGIYSPAAGLINALFVIPTTVFFMLVPVLSRQYSENPVQLHQTNRRVTLGFAVLGLAMVLVVGIAGSWLLYKLLGPAYLATSAVLIVLSPLLFFKCLEFGWAAFLVAVGWQKQRLIPQVVSAVANVMVNLWAIPRFGVAGVAMVYVASELILTIGYAGLVFKWMRQHPRVEQNK